MGIRHTRRNTIYGHTLCEFSASIIPRQIARKIAGEHGIYQHLNDLIALAERYEECSQTSELVSMVAEFETKETRKFSCKGCKDIGHIFAECPDRNIRCRNCNIIGHRSVNCRNTVVRDKAGVIRGVTQENSKGVNVSHKLDNTYTQQLRTAKGALYTQLQRLDRGRKKQNAKRMVDRLFDEDPSENPEEEEEPELRPERESLYVKRADTKDEAVEVDFDEDDVYRAYSCLTVGLNNNHLI